MAIDTQRRIDVFLERGWCPVPWAHHPKAIKDALRFFGIRPQMKQCFANCQRFTVLADLDVEYHEGWVLSVIPIEHAWLKYEGQIVDLTLVPREDPVQYLDSIAYSRSDIRQNMIRTQSWRVIDPDALARLHPYRAEFEEFAKKMGGQP